MRATTPTMTQRSTVQKLSLRILDLPDPTFEFVATGLLKDSCTTPSGLKRTRHEDTRLLIPTPQTPEQLQFHVVAKFEMEVVPLPMAMVVFPFELVRSTLHEARSDAEKTIFPEEFTTFARVHQLLSSVQADCLLNIATTQHSLLAISNVVYAIG